MMKFQSSTIVPMVCTGTKIRSRAIFHNTSLAAVFVLLRLVQPRLKNQCRTQLPQRPHHSPVWTVPESSSFSGILLTARSISSAHLRDHRWCLAQGTEFGIRISSPATLKRPPLVSLEITWILMATAFLRHLQQPSKHSPITSCDHSTKSKE